MIHLNIDALDFFASELRDNVLDSPEQFEPVKQFLFYWKKKKSQLEKEKKNVHLKLVRYL